MRRVISFIVQRKLNFGALVFIIIAYIVGIALAHVGLGFGFEVITPILPLSFFILILTFYISKEFFSRLAWQDTKYVLEISDNYDEHTLYAVSSRAFKKIRLARPILISFGDIIYADLFDTNNLVLVPTWVHEKIEFLKDKEAMSYLKREHELLEKEYSEIKAIWDIRAQIEARKRIQLLENIKAKMLKEALGDEN